MIDCKYQTHCTIPEMTLNVSTFHWPQRMKVREVGALEQPQLLPLMPDTMGYADPHQVGELLTKAREVAGWPKTMRPQELTA